MKSKRSLEKLLRSTRQYHARALLSPDKFISLFTDTLSELKVTKKIDAERLESEIRDYLDIVDWFGHVSTKITQNFFDKGLDIAVIDKDGSKAQHITNSDLFTNYIITEYIEERHKKKFGSSMPELHSHQGIKPSDIQRDWHTATQDNGITLTVETVVSSLIEYERSYLSQLASRGTLAALQNIQKIFSSVSYSNPTEATIIQILEQCTELYLMQYEISSTLLPFHLSDEGISSNIDKIYETYSPGKDQMVRKIVGMISVIARQTGDKTSKKKIAKELERLADDVITASIIDEWEHPETVEFYKKIIEKFKSKSTEPALAPRKQKTDERIRPEVEVVEPPKVVNMPKTAIAPPKKIEALNAVKSEPQSVEITKEPVPASNKNEDTKSLSIEDILAKYCVEKVSENEYRVVGNFFIMKEDGRYVLQKLMGMKTAGKGDEAYDEPQYKLVSRTPYFVIATTEHLEKGDQGIRLSALTDVGIKEHINLTMGEVSTAKLKKVLRNNGILIDAPKENVEYIDSLSLEVENPIFVSDKVGWVEHAGQFGFVLPNGKGIGITGLEYSNENSSLSNAISQGGDLQEWLSIFDVFKLEEAHPRLQFLVFSSLMPLFAEYYSLFSGITINIGPDDSEEKKSSNGKSVMLRLLLSAQGNSTESSRSWFGNWKINLQGLEKSLYTCVGSYHDDTSIKDTGMTDKDIEDIIYSISTGKSRETSVKDGRDRRTVLFSSGESDILGHGAKDGAYVRFINIGIKRTDYGSGDTKPIVDHIEKMTKKHYGFVYPEAIRIMLKDQEAILSRINNYQTELLKVSRHDLASRLAKQYAVIAVCGDVFIEAVKTLSNGKYDFSSIDTFEVSREMFIAHDQKLLDMDSTEQKLSGNLLDDFLNNFKKNEQHQLHNKDGEKVGFVKDSKYHIISGKVKGHLPVNMTKNNFIDKLNGQGQLIEKSKAITQNKKTARYDIFKKSNNE